MAPKPPLKATRWTDPQLEALAEVSPADIEEAKAWARRHSRKEPDGTDPVELLEAEADPTE